MLLYVYIYKVVKFFRKDLKTHNNLTKTRQIPIQKNFFVKNGFYKTLHVYKYRYKYIITITHQNIHTPEYSSPLRGYTIKNHFCQHFSIALFYHTQNTKHTKTIHKNNTKTLDNIIVI